MDEQEHSYGLYLRPDTPHYCITPLLAQSPLPCACTALALEMDPLGAIWETGDEQAHPWSLLHIASKFCHPPQWRWLEAATASQDAMDPLPQLSYATEEQFIPNLS